MALVVRLEIVGQFGASRGVHCLTGAPEAPEIASMLSAMSLRRCAELLEGIHGIAENRISEQRFQSLAVDHIRGTAEQFSDIELHTRVFKDADGCKWIEIDEYVDVAVLLHFATDNRPEHSGMTNPSAA